MISDWTFEQSYALITEKFREQGFPMPENGWTCNPQWEDWGFEKGNYRAYVKPDMRTEWSVFRGLHDPVSTGIEAVWQDALLAAEHAVNWHNDNPKTPLQDSRDVAASQP